MCVATVQGMIYAIGVGSVACYDTQMKEWLFLSSLKNNIEILGCTS